MTYNVSSGTLNPTIPSSLIAHALHIETDRKVISIAEHTTYRVTTCLENREMLGNLTASGILLKIRELSGKKSCEGKVA